MSFEKMNDSFRVLIVDDDLAQAEMMSEFLHLSGYMEVDRVSDIRGLWPQLKKNSYDIILLDYILPDGTGLDVLDQMANLDLHTPVVMVTGQGSERIAVEAIQRGASDYLLKSGDYLVTLPALISKTIQSYQLKLSVQHSLDQVQYQALLLNNVRDAVVVWDLTGRITFWNPAATSLFGWNAKERLDRPVVQFYLQTFTPPISLSNDGDTTGQHVVRKYINREGKTIWISSRVTALRDVENKGRLIGYMDVSHDISRRVEAEQALRESEARYRAIVEDYQTELICRFKPNGTLTFVNEMYCRYFNKTRDELLGMNFLYFVPEIERPRIIKHLVSLGQDKPMATIEHQVTQPEQGTRWLQRTDRAILNERGRILEFQSVARDTTEKRRMEAQIQAAQSHLIQVARMATIGEVASGVAHQIYNPLTTIIADAQILLRTLSPEQPGRDSAEAIEQAGWRLQHVVQHLMELSRPADETLNPIHVNETIQSAVSLVSDHIEAIGCRFETKLGKELPLVRGSRSQLESLWINLLLLARDACSEGQGTAICIQSRAESPDTIVVEVNDDGKTIPPEHINMIFEPNFAGTTIGRGTGMELSICREIVRQHGGQISAESLPLEKNAGRRDTIFRVTLPAEV